jgi:hypothetical protein
VTRGLSTARELGLLVAEYTGKSLILMFSAKYDKNIENAKPEADDGRQSCNKNTREI